MNIRLLMTHLTIITMMTACNTELKTDKLGIQVSREENREYSYTDKKAGYWYGTTHQENPEFWSGWNMAKKRILADYTLGAGGRVLDRKEAEVTVYPDRLERRWEDVSETFMLLDEKPVIYIKLEADQDISIEIDMSHISGVSQSEEGLVFTPAEAADKRIMLTTAEKTEFTSRNNGIEAGPEAGGFLLTYGTEEECKALVDEFRCDSEGLIDSRKKRINALVTDYNPLKTNLPELDKALDWITITMDELITEQQGNGIYAGLPWLNWPTFSLSIPLTMMMF